MADTGEHHGKGPKGAAAEGTLEKAVHHALTVEPWLDATDIVLKVEGDVAVLSGTVTTADAKVLAVKTAGGVKGVTSVTDNLTVLANSGVAETNRIRNITDHGR